MNATNHVDAGASARKRGPFLQSVVRLPRVSIVMVRTINVAGGVLVIQCSCKWRGFGLGFVAEKLFDVCSIGVRSSRLTDLYIV